MTELVRVFLVDDHEIVRRGIAQLIDAEEDLEVVGEAATAAQARARIPAVEPDVVLLDVRLPDGNGIDVCRTVRAAMPQVHCLMLTAYDDDEALRSAVLAGASGYVLKDVRGNKLVESVRLAASGRSLIDPAFARRMVAQLEEPAPSDPRFDTLGLRERQILALIASGLTNRQIADRLKLAEKTVKNYVSSLLSKLGLEHRTQAAILHLEHQQPR